MPEIKPIHRIFASLVFNKRYVMEQVPEQDRDAVQHVLDTEYSD